MDPLIIEVPMDMDVARMNISLIVYDNVTLDLPEKVFFQKCIIVLPENIKLHHHHLEAK